MEETTPPPGLTGYPEIYEKPDIIIVGTGAVGTALAVELARRDYPIVAIVSREKERAEQLAGKVGSPFAFSLSDTIPTDARLVFLCIPDDAITPTAKLLAGASAWQDKIVAHTSGALAASALQPLARRGAYLMSFHPLQTFSNAQESPLSNIYIGIEGDDEAIQEGIKIAHALGSKELILTAEQKPRYHLAASIASNFYVTLMAMACDVLESIGVQRNEAVALLRPLVTQTCINVTSNLPEEVLTGPASRGDEKTLMMHLDVIENHLPHFKSLYKALLVETLEVAVKETLHGKSQLSRAKVEAIQRKLKKI